MATTCTAGETILAGDAVCVTGYDTVNNQPTVKRASAANLATSKTVFGVADANSGGGTVSVRSAGEVVKESITSLGAGDSRIIATDITAGTAANQCRLIRIDRPNGSEHVVGTCDENGNLAVIPRASRETSAQHVFNVCAYGAVADCTDHDLMTGSDQSNAFKACLDAIAAAGGGGHTMYIPPSFPKSYRLDEDLSLQIRGLRLVGGSNGTTSLPGTELQSSYRSRLM